MGLHWLAQVSKSLKKNKQQKTKLVLINNQPNYNRLHPQSHLNMMNEVGLTFDYVVSYS